MAVTRSLTGPSELRIGESWSSLSPGGVQRVISQPIGMKTKPRRRTGLAGVLASAVAAGTIPSRGRKGVGGRTTRRGLRWGGAFFLLVRVDGLFTGRVWLFRLQDFSR